MPGTQWHMPWSEQNATSAHCVYLWQLAMPFIKKLSGMPVHLLVSAQN
jgi:hypothetical protein